ncbi:MAG: hypothetical protein IT175_14310 [Acidobacteria bacterium]|nr:hypothetical protein [Acidobacteriota bacterium]
MKRFAFVVCATALLLTLVSQGTVRAQEPAPAPAQPAAAAPQGPTEGTQAERDALLNERLKQITQKQPKDWSPEVLAERVAIAYRGFNFAQLKKVYNTGREEGRITIVTTTGELAGEYTRRHVNGAKMLQDRVRLDIIFETSPKPEQQLRYTLTYNGASVWAAQDQRYTTPDPAAGIAFKASVVNDYTALFRYADEGATLKRLGVKRLQGIDHEVLEMTRPEVGTMRFFISPKSFKILHVEYDVVLGEGQAPVVFRESYSEWKLLQEVLVPGKRKLRQNEQLVQTIELNAATYGVAVDDNVFLQL